VKYILTSNKLQPAKTNAYAITGNWNQTPHPQ